MWKKYTVAKYLQDNIDDIIELRTSGILAKDIAKIYDTSPSSIVRALEKNGVFTRNLYPMTKENENTLLEEYKNGKTLKEIAIKYGVSPDTISKLLDENNIPKRSSYRTTYSLNENYFDVIDTQEKAYILGFLAADGCVHKNTITLSLQENDKHILDEINTLLGSNRHLYYIKRDVGKNQYRLAITNQHMAQQLKNKGIIENKSLKFEFPECITDELLPHFLRGLLDGDGSIGKTRYYISYTGTRMLLFKIVDKLNKIMNLHFYSREEHCYNGITYSIELYRQQDCIDFLNYIYKDATIYLKRKYETYLKYVDKTLLKVAS